MNNTANMLQYVYLQVLVPLYHARSLPHPLDFLN